jgi:PEP-CTERM motif
MISMKNCARAASALSLALSAPAMAATFDFSGGGVVNGAIRSYTSTTDASLKVQASAFCFCASIQTATLGSYSSGLGITDSAEDGSLNTHTVDNQSGFDFILLVFNKAVNLSTAVLSPFAVGANNTTADNDAFVNYGTLANAFQNVPVAVSLANAQSIANGANGKNVAGNLAAGNSTALNSPNAYSNVWVIGAARSGYNTIDGNVDGFKLKSIDAVAAVPEPATWGMMIGGMGIAGMALRRRRSTAIAQVIA